MRFVATILAVLIILAGCATTRTTRVADLAKGDFYTNDEIKGLSQVDRDLYCEALNAEIEELRAESEVLMARADSMVKVSDSLKVVNTNLTTKIRDLDGEIRTLRLTRRGTTTYVVKAGDTLQKISSVMYGQSNRWRDIYNANKGAIGSPDAALRVGTRLQIPAK